MSRSWRLLLQDITEAGEKIRRYTDGMTLKDFTDNDLVFDAVVRNLEIIGEAAKAIPQDVRERSTAIDWRRIAGLRDVLAHTYFALDDATLWDIVENKVPELLAEVYTLRESTD